MANREAPIVNLLKKAGIPNPEGFLRGIKTARSIPMNTADPTFSYEEVTKKNSPGLTKAYTQGRALEGQFGESGLDTMIKRQQKRSIYKPIFNKGMINEFKLPAETMFGDTVTPEMVGRSLPGAIAADFATSADKFVRGITGAAGIKNVDTSPLWTAGGRLASEGEFAAVSRRGDKSGVSDDLLNAGNLGLYFATGTGAALKGSKVLLELAKKRNAAKAAMAASKSKSVRIPAEIGETASQTIGYSLYN